MRRFLVSLALLLAAAAAFAQQAPPPPQLTWIRFYEVLPGKGPDFMRLMKERSSGALDKLIAEKKVAGWGVVVPMTRNGDPWTHAVYITVNDWSVLEELGNAGEAAETQRAPAETKRLDELTMSTIRFGSQRDVVLRHWAQGNTPPFPKPKYIGTDYYVIKPGRAGDLAALFNEWAQPIFTTAAGSGKFGPWGLSTQEVTTDGSWTHMVWYFMSDLGALDAMMAAAMGLGPQAMRAFDVRLRDMSEPEKHRRQILRVVHAAP